MAADHGAADLVAVLAASTAAADAAATKAAQEVGTRATAGVLPLFSPASTTIHGSGYWPTLNIFVLLKIFNLFL